MEYLETLQSWSRPFQILLLGLFSIGCAAMAVVGVHLGPCTRQQKNVAILAFVVMFLVVASAVAGLMSR